MCAAKSKPARRCEPLDDTTIATQIDHLLQAVPYTIPHGGLAAPNAALRGALFIGANATHKKALRREVIASLPNLRVIFTGLRLDQADLDCWLAVMQAMHECRSGLSGDCDPSGTVAGRFRVNGTRLLHLMGIQNNGRSQELLDIRLSKLRSASIEIEIVGGLSYEGGLIVDVYRDQINRELVIGVNPKLAQLFAQDAGWTNLQLAVRQKLGRNQLAKWLYAYLASHDRPYSLSVERIRELSGSDIVQLFRFRQYLKSTLKVVNEATGWKLELDPERDCLVGEPIRLKVKPNQGFSIF